MPGTAMDPLQRHSYLPDSQTEPHGPGLRPRPSLRGWFPVIVITAGLGGLLYALFNPWAQGCYDVNWFISQYGNTWFPAVIAVFVGLLGALPTAINAKRSFPMWGWEMGGLVVEFLLALTVFYFVVMPRYSYLELPDQGLYYFGQVMGNAAKGQGRAFDGEKRLIYCGGFDNNLFEGQGTFYGVDEKFIGRFHNGKCNGYAEQWFTSGEADEMFVYKGYFWDGVRHGHGTILRGDGSLHTEGGFEFGDQVSGSRYREDGSIYYSGQWKNNLPNGIGTFFYADGSPYYYGDVVDGKMQGYGKTYLEDGSAYQNGWFENGEYYGPKSPTSWVKDNSEPNNTIVMD